MPCYNNKKRWISRAQKTQRARNDGSRSVERRPLSVWGHRSLESKEVVHRENKLNRGDVDSARNVDPQNCQHLQRRTARCLCEQTLHPAEPKAQPRQTLSAVLRSLHCTTVSVHHRRHSWFRQASLCFPKPSSQAPVVMIDKIKPKRFPHFHPDEPTLSLEELPSSRFVD